MKLSTLLFATVGCMAATTGVVWVATPRPVNASPVSVAATSNPLPTLDPTTLPSDRFEAGDVLRLEGRLGHATLAANRDTETFVYLDLTASDATAVTPAPVNLAIVLDRSRSMEGQRMANALNAARGMIRRLRDGDVVSVVAYNTGVETLISPTEVTSANRLALLQSLDNVKARGHTCVSCGIETGLSLLNRKKGAVNRIVLLSDGEANTGIRDLAGFRTMAERAQADDVSLTTIGVDVDYNERVMLALAQASNGRHYFVEDSSGLSTIFESELKSLIQTVASGAEVELKLADGVRLDQVYDRTFIRDGDRLRVPLGTFARNDNKTVLMRLHVRPGSEASPVAEVRLHYRDLVHDEPASCEGELVASVTSNPDAVAALDPLVEARVSRAETSLALIEANEKFVAGQTAAAQSVLHENRNKVSRRRAVSRKKKAPAGVIGRVDEDFDRQLEALDKAGAGFSSASNAAPAEPQATRAGRAQVRQSVEDVAELLR